MGVIKPLNHGSTAYRDAIQALLPRGPIWDIGSEPTLGAFVEGTAVEPANLHGRFVDLIAEADPRTTDELLDEWIAAWGLPAPCGEMPATDDGKRAMLAAKVAAQGGQSRAYFIAIAYAALPASYAASGLEWVTIEEHPYGVPFRVGLSRVGDPLNGEGSMFYWVMHLPTTFNGTETGDVIECLIGHYKPAHTIVSFVYNLGFLGP